MTTLPTRIWWSACSLAPPGPMHMATLYGGGAAGYTDYPAHTATATA
jgi:hypothetical protein